MNRVPHIKKIKKFIKKMETGDYWFENNQILLVLWRVKKHALLVSNVGDDNIIQV